MKKKEEKKMDPVVIRSYAIHTYWLGVDFKMTVRVFGTLSASLLLELFARNLFSKNKTISVNTNRKLINYLFVFIIETLYQYDLFR